jgi:hypothetical protein
VPSISPLLIDTLPPWGYSFIVAEIRLGNLTVTILFADCEPTMLAYDAVDQSCRDPVVIPIDSSILMISGKIPLCALLWMGTNQPPGLISIAMLSPPIFNLPII